MSELSQAAAFFDVDNTLLNLKSMFSFREFYLDRWLPQHARDRGTYADFLSDWHCQADGMPRETLNRRYYEWHRGDRPEFVRDAAIEWFREISQEFRERLWVPSAIELLCASRNASLLPVAVSGSCHEILAPVMAALDIKHVLATRLEVIDGRYTGHIEPPQLIGDGKAQALRAFAQRHGLDLDRSLACGDHISDLTMLAAVGRPVVVCGDSSLEAIARERGWEILRSADPLPELAQTHA